MLGKTITKKVRQDQSFNTEVNIEKSSIRKVVTEEEYKTKGEYVLVINSPQPTTIILDETTTPLVVIKALSEVTIKHHNLIDGYYHEILMNNRSSVELCEVEGTFYIIASDGLKFV